MEVFAQGIGVSAEDFKRLTVKTSLRRTSSRLWAEKGYMSQLESFLSGIRTGTEPAVTARDGARATVVCLRMLESARTQSPCAISLDEVLG